MSAVRHGNQTLAVVMLKGEAGRVGVLNVTDPGRMDLLWSVSLNHTVDLDTVAAGGIPYMAAMNHTGVHMLNMTTPAPSGMAVPADAVLRGAVATTIHDGIPYVSYADQSEWRILDVSAPADPRIVRTAGLGGANVTEYALEWAGDTILGSFSQGCLHVLDGSDIYAPAFRTVDVRDVRAAAIQDTQLVAIAVAGHTPGLRIVDTSPEGPGAVSFTPTNGTVPVDMAAVNLYGMPYILMTIAPGADHTSALLVFDVYNAAKPVLVHAIHITGEARLDTTGTGDSAYAILAGSDGEVHAIRLTGGGS